MFGSSQGEVNKRVQNVEDFSVLSHRLLCLLAVFVPVTQFLFVSLVFRHPGLYSEHPEYLPQGAAIVVYKGQHPFSRNERLVAMLDMQER